MDAVSVEELSRLLRGKPAPVLLDVRREAARVEAGAQIAGAVWHDPAHWLDWKDSLAQSPGPVVLYCAHGMEIGQGLTAALRAMGVPAFFLQGGFADWQAAGCPVQALTQATPAGSLWVTRERPKIDRIACPWLVARFIDPQARFLFVPAAEVLQVAEQTGAMPFDIPGVALSHVGPLCSFDAFLERYALQTPALRQLAGIVRGADTGQLDLTPQSAGLYAFSLGLSKRFADDQEMLGHGMVMYDALHTWCEQGQGETHNWPPAM